MFNKVLIANRGEIALRVIRACRELGIRTVAVYSTADKNSLHVKFADEAVCIGPPPSRDSYLNIPRVIAAAVITNSDAIHPGYGFLAESARFAEICEESGFTFIGPSPDSIRMMGDKSVAKDTMRKAGVPVVPGSDGVIETFEQAKITAAEVGYPVMIKAAAGGGGKGMRIVNNESEIEKAFNNAQNESQAAFNDGRLYIEKFVEEPRHVEIQVMCDKYGNYSHMNERECSIQRRHQKLIEEAPSPIVDDELRKKMGDASIKGCAFVKYEGAGTVEFLVDKHKNFYFMEMNTRIQVEHPVTEEALDFDLIKEQISIAAGEKLSFTMSPPKRFAMEVRINAEDPYNDFRPSPGKIETLYLPGGRGVRVDTHIYQGYIVPPNYDSMLAKLITFGRTRLDAIIRMRRALDEIVIEGVKTTIPFHKMMMEHPKFLRGDFDTKFIDTHEWRHLLPPENH
ncbi:MAG: acetyl-CoA carboxylase biotin carboxylase subunit [Chlorobiota bacterium]|jgi:acetyl-CoA carboxylase biotin carboxylase subunit|nr:acetyl-CoA carboxylase biotin carboxylase subunit [Chlorobiota bacterium]QQS66122.1 MAG: acetyl-CoA carboxylase biotin carboxylase subunit [Chlorobiota bacterium]